MNDRQSMEFSFALQRHMAQTETEEIQEQINAQAKQKDQKQVYVIRRTIFLIFVSFSAIIMLCNLGMLTIGLSYNKLQIIIEQGARPPTLVNIAIMAEAGSTISLDSIAQSQNDLLIAKSFFERILADKQKLKEQVTESATSKQLRRMLEDWEFNDITTIDAGVPQITVPIDSGIPQDTVPIDTIIQQVTENENIDSGIPQNEDGSDLTEPENEEEEDGEEGDTTQDDENQTEENEGNLDDEKTEETDEKPSDDVPPADETTDGDGKVDEKDEDDQTTDPPVTPEEPDTDDDEEEEEVIPEPLPPPDPCELKPGFHAIPSFCLNQTSIPSFDVNMYYTSGLHTKKEDWSAEQDADFEICSDLLFLVKDLLSFEYNNFPKLRGYVGFQSGGFCRNPSQFITSLYTAKPEFKSFCQDQSGYYNVQCRPWYRKSLQHPNETVMLDLYPDAFTKQLVTTICTNVHDPSTGNFYAAMCMDVTIFQDYFDTPQTEDILGPMLFYRPTILQTNNNLAFKHLSENILRSQIESLTFSDSNNAQLYGNVQINLGTFKVSEQVNEFNYTKLDKEEKYGIMIDPDQESKTQIVFFIFSDLVFNSLTDFAAASFQFFIFGHYEGIARINEMESHLIVTIFGFWMPYLIAASAMYMIICSLIINYIAKNMTKPFLELSARIRLNVENIKRQKRLAEQAERTGHKGKKFNSIELQVDLLRNFKPRNRETNELFMRFNQMAKILYIGQASSQMEFSHQAFFDLTAAGELLKDMNMQRACGACYMIIGIMLAMQSHTTYHRCINYIRHAENLQEQIIESYQNQRRELGRDSSSASDNPQKLMEDKYILAFRQYTRAIISHNYFVRMDEESRCKNLNHEQRRVDNMRAFESVGLDALEYFEKSLETWPDPEFRQFQRYDTFWHTQNQSKSDIRMTVQSYYGKEKEMVDADFERQNQDSPSPHTNYENTQTKSKAKPKFHDQKGLIALEKHELTMVQKPSPLKMLHKESFEAHLDRMLLSDPYRNDYKTSQDPVKADQVPALNCNQISTDANLAVVQQNFSGQNPNILPRVHRLSMSSDRSPLPPQINNQDLDEYVESEDESEDDSDRTSQQYSDEYPDRTYRTDPAASMISEPDQDDSQDQRLLTNMQSFRHFGGRKHGVLQEGQIQDGFYDYRIYIRLLMCELKILLLPLYQRLVRTVNRQDGDDMDGSIRGTIGQESSEELSARKSNASNEPINSVSNIWENHSPDQKTNKPRIVNLEKLDKYRKFFGGIDSDLPISERYSEQLTDLKEIDTELYVLQQKVHKYSIRRLSRVRRMGLPKLKKSFLMQNFYYLQGLRLYNLGDRSELELMASMRSLQTSLNCSTQQVNIISKKTFFKLNNIFELLYDQKWHQMYNSKYSVIDHPKLQKKSKSEEQKQLPPRRLTKELIDGMQNTRKKSVRVDPHLLHVFQSVEKIDETASHASFGTSQYASKREENVAPSSQPESNDSLKMIVTNLRWVRQHLSHHVVSRRSICFVLDTYFEHYKQHSLCRDFIIDTFEELDEEDYFGLFIRQDQNGRHNDEFFEINLEQKGRNERIKDLLLERLTQYENDEPRRMSNSYMVQQVAQALHQSAQLPEKVVQYQDLQFVSPIKWVVVFLGSLKGLQNTSLLDIEDNTNLIVVYFTDETPERDTIANIRKMIKSECLQGGLMIVRFMESENQNKRSSDVMIRALQRVKSMISLYPSKNMPIIQEKFAL